MNKNRIQELVALITYPNKSYTLPGEPIVATIEEKQAYMREWKQFTEYQRGNIQLPARLQAIIQENLNGNHDIWEYANKWYTDLVFYRGDVATTSDWVFVTNGGNFYKHGTSKCVWETRSWIDREKHPYDMASHAGRQIAMVGKNYLYLGCETGGRHLMEKLAQYYFAVDLVGKYDLHVSR